MKIKIDEKALLTLSSGILAGMGTTISFAGVPAILASKDPAPVWKMFYTRGMKIALTTIVISTATSLRCYFKTEDLGYLLVTVLTVTIVPYTLVLMKPTNAILIAAATEDKSKPSDEGKIRQLVKKWDKLQYFRTFLGLSAFVATIALVSKK